MKLTVYPAIVQKLRSKHQVEMHEVEEAFLNRTGRLARELRQVDPKQAPRYWFIADTDGGRRLKVVYALDRAAPAPVLITAYPPNEREERLYATLK